MYTAGQGTTLERGQASGASLPAIGSDVFDFVGLISGLKLPNDVRRSNTFNTLDSPDPRKVGGGFEERLVSFRIVMDSADAVTLGLKTDAKTASSTDARRNWRVVLPDTGAYTLTWVGFVQKWEWEDIQSETEIAANVEIAVDGAVTETP